MKCLLCHNQIFEDLRCWLGQPRPYHNDLGILLAINKQKVSALVLLDLSATFDTIDHKILLSRLFTGSFHGLSNTALYLIVSYFLDQTQSVSIQSHSTPPSAIFTGIPQGSVLGLLLFSLYTSPISQIFTKASISYHLYADDTQIYISFPPNQSYDSLSLLSTLDEVYAWLTSNRLSVNPSKTEFLIIGNPQQRNKIQSSSIVFCGNIISPSSSARNLGVTFDSSLSLTKQISQYANLHITRSDSFVRFDHHWIFPLLLSLQIHWLYQN